MNQKGQGEAGIVIIFLLIIFVVGAFVGSVFFPVNYGYENVASNNFCEAWANQQEVSHLKGSYQWYPSDGWEIHCRYSNDAETFDGGISEGKIQNKYFKISKEDLQEWMCKK